MNTKSMLGALVAGLVLFVYGFIYWAVNPLPYMVWNDIADPAAMQAAAAELFPEDGVYFIPGAGNDPEAIKLLETGPSVYVTIDHSPVAGPDPFALATGLLHNIFSAFLLTFVLASIAGLGRRVIRATILGVIAVFVINVSEVIWWQQPFDWIMHQMIYYLIYFALAALVLHFFMSTPAAGSDDGI